MLAFFKIWVIQVSSFIDVYTILMVKFIRFQIGTSLAVQMFLERSPIVHVLDIAWLFI